MLGAALGRTKKGKARKGRLSVASCGMTGNLPKMPGIWEKHQVSSHSMQRTIRPSSISNMTTHGYLSSQRACCCSPKEASRFAVSSLSDLRGTCRECQQTQHSSARSYASGSTSR